MRIDIAHSMTAISADEWNRLAASAGLYSSHEWLTTVEAETEGTCRYLLAHDASGALVAALPVYFLTSEWNPRYRPAERFPALGRTLGHAPVCLFGGRSAYQGQLLVDPSLSGAARIEPVAALVEAVRSLAGGQDRTYAFGFYLTYTTVADLLAVPGLRCRPLLDETGETRLPRIGDTFDDYLTALGHRRRKAVREIRRFTEAGLCIELGDPWQLMPVTVELVGQLQDKYGSATSREQLEAMISRQCAAFGDRVRLFVCRGGGRVLGVALTFIWGDWLYLRLGGFRYDQLPGAFEYFNLGCYAPLQYCYEAGLDGVHLGTGSLDAKLGHGAIVEPLSTFVLPLTPGADDPVWEQSRARAATYWAQQRSQRPRAFPPELWDGSLAAAMPAEMGEVGR